MRALVGRTEDEVFDNPTGALVIPGIDAVHYRSVLDFGCGCGRIARQLIQQRPRPERYAGLDLHPGMITWCQENLAPRARGFSFHHHDVRYEPFNPGPAKPLSAPLPFGPGEFTLVVAISVFTHLTQEQAEHDLAEIARVLDPEGIFVSTWFLFDKPDFPMMQDDQNTGRHVPPEMPARADRIGLGG
jgi:SAM-dependent methyltransferase